jgi:hypothetical protein
MEGSVLSFLKTEGKVSDTGSASGGGNWSTQRKPQTCGKLLTNFITLCCIEYTLP